MSVAARDAVAGWLQTALEPHIGSNGLAFMTSAQNCDLGDLGPKLALASRHARGKPLEPSGVDCCKAAGIIPGWNPERLQILEALRLALLHGRGDLETPAFADAYLGLFPYADEGELRALYKALAILPDPARFAWQAGEGLRTNVLGVFEAVACDSPFPAAHLDDVAWRSLCIKALFVGAPLWRVHGLDGRLSPELARMALDLVEERRSAGRAIMGDLWLCLGAHGGDRGTQYLLEEWEALPAGSRGSVALALDRAGQGERLRNLPSESADQAHLERALEGNSDQGQWRAFWA